MTISQLSRPATFRFMASIAVLALALAAGTAGPSWADASDVPIPSRRAAAPDGAAGSHVHEVHPAPRPSLKDTLSNVWNRDTLTGDWGGLRTDLSDHGISIGLRLTQYFQDVSSGGANRNNEFGGKFDYRLHVDGQKALGLWSGLSFDLHAESRWGRDIVADAGPITLPNSALLTPLPGNFSDTEITSLLVTQALMGGRVAVTAGKLQVVDLETMLIPNTSFGQEGFSTLSGLATGWPFLRFVNLAMYGGAVMLMNPEHGMIEGALVAFGQSNVSTSWDWEDSFDDGVGFLGMWRFFFDVCDLPGNVVIAAGGATKKYHSLETSPFTEIPGSDRTEFVLMLPSLSGSKKRPWAVASYVYQELWNGGKGDPRKVYLFMGGALADQNPSFARWNAFASIEAIGALPMRRNDRAGFSGWYIGVNDDVEDLLAIAGLDVGDAWGFEAYYNLALNQWLHVTGDLQLVQNANEDDSIAVIPGVRFVVDF